MKKTTLSTLGLSLTLISSAFASPSHITNDSHAKEQLKQLDSTNLSKQKDYRWSVNINDPDKLITGLSCVEAYGSNIQDHKIKEYKVNDYKHRISIDTNGGPKDDVTKSFDNLYTSFVHTKDKYMYVRGFVTCTLEIEDSTIHTIHTCKMGVASSYYSVPGSTDVVDNWWLGFIKFGYKPSTPANTSYNGLLGDSNTVKCGGLNIKVSGDDNSTNSFTIKKES